MDNLQYLNICLVYILTFTCFKPYYKWIIFNIQSQVLDEVASLPKSFKPYYKWIIFNIDKERGIKWENR